MPTPASNHPRWRGADLFRRCSGTRVPEPPPLARGRHAARGPPETRFRTTPAGAGPTTARAALPSPVGNHPRWRGADSAKRAAMTPRAEPPPLARGRQIDAQVAGGEPRTTPAGAGPTCSPPPAALPTRNHPRWRGADPPDPPLVGPAGEPPPLARGRLEVGGGQVEIGGTTPAGAGPTSTRPPSVSPGQNHPRWRGADRSGTKARARSREPPPLARGRLSKGVDDDVLVGTTPAGAGPTASAVVGTAGASNHPRWRGADLPEGPLMFGCGEPPPLARGRPARVRYGLHRRRTTPAGAGPTIVPGRIPRSGKNHPRWRGADGRTPWTS